MAEMGAVKEVEETSDSKIQCFVDNLGKDRAGAVSVVNGGSQVFHGYLGRNRASRQVGSNCRGCRARDQLTSAGGVVGSH